MTTSARSSLRARLGAIKHRALRRTLRYLQNRADVGQSSDPVVDAIRGSGLFDLPFYNAQLASPFPDQPSAVAHYVREGAKSGLAPNPYFDGAWYVASYRDVLAQDRNPLLDFIQQGHPYARNPSAAFDCGWYLSRNRDVARAGMNPLLHYLRNGAAEGRSASPFAEDPLVPARFRSLFAELTPQDGDVLLQSRFEICPVPETAKVTGRYEAAGHQASGPRGDRGDVFPPRPYIARFSDVGIVGGTRLIVQDPETVLSDEISAFSDSPGWAVRPHSFQMGQDGALRLTLTRRYASDIDRGAHLMHEYASNYFHMITEVLPRLIAADAAGLDPTLPLLLQDGLHPNLLKLITLVDPHARQQVVLTSRQLYRISELHYLSDTSSVQDVYRRARRPEETVIHLDLLREVARRVVTTFLPETPRPWRHIYVRRGNHYRGLLNEAAVEELLLDRGFEVVLLDGLSLSAQVRLFRQAATIIAPTGAALTNILWSQPGTRVCTLSAQHDAMPTEIWEQVGAASGCSVISLRGRRAYNVDGEYALHDDYAVDTAELLRIADDMVSSDRPAASPVQPVA